MTSQAEAPEPDALAILDEAGFTGKVRNLTRDHDGKIGLVAALMLPTPDLAHWEAIFKPPYDAFAAAAPPGATLHITGAFAPGHTAWAAVATQARTEIYALVRSNQLGVAYIAREASVARKTHEASLDLTARSKAAKSPHLSVSERPSDTRLVSECYEGLVSTIDIMAESVGSQHVALYADEIDEGVLKIMEADAGALRNLSKRDVELRGFDTRQKTPLRRTMRFSTNVPGIDVTRVGTITKLPKSNSLVFAIDVIANALLHHLEQHPIGTSLNILKSVERWGLADCVFAPTDECYDIYSKV